MCIIITHGVHNPADLTCLMQGSSAHVRQEACSKLQFCAKSACKSTNCFTIMHCQCCSWQAQTCLLELLYYYPHLLKVSYFSVQQKEESVFSIPSEWLFQNPKIAVQLTANNLFGIGASCTAGPL